MAVAWRASLRRSLFSCRWSSSTARSTGCEFSRRRFSWLLPLQSRADSTDDAQDADDKDREKQNTNDSAHRLLSTANRLETAAQFGELCVGRFDPFDLLDQPGGTGCIRLLERQQRQTVKARDVARIDFQCLLQLDSRLILVTESPEHSAIHATGIHAAGFKLDCLAEPLFGLIELTRFE